MSKTTSVISTPEKADRLKQLPPYLFVELDRAKRALQADGKDLVDLGVGDPDLPTPAPIIERLKTAAEDPANHRYSVTEGIREVREAIAGWYARRFNVTLDPATEILPLLGSKEGIAHLPLALTNPGDLVLVPDPGYPPYGVGSLLAGAEVVTLPLLEAHGFFPEIGGINQRVAQRAKLMYLNYPNNPTGAVAGWEQFQEVIAFANASQCAVAHDAAYSEIAFDGFRPLSFLQLPGAKSVGIEFHSLSKTYSMTGWRIGWACGNAQIISALTQLKTYLDSGVFQPIQWAAIAALEGDQGVLRSTIAIYQERRDLLVQGLADAGWQIPKPKAGLYVWARVPTQESSMAFSTRVLQEARVLITPGVGFGAAGEGYIRMSLTVPTPRLREAVDRIRKVL